MLAACEMTLAQLVDMRNNGDKRFAGRKMGGDPASYIPAHTSPAAAASFRT